MVLAVESSGKTASVAVIDGKKVVCESSQTTGFFHSQTLMVLLNNMLTVAGIELNQIDLVAVANGPGSFTGVRIGVSAARGLATGLGVNCAGVSTLRGLAANLMGLPVFACALIEARNDFFYFGLFDMEKEQQQIGVDEFVAFSDLTTKLQNLSTKKPIVFVGDGAKVCYFKLKDMVAGGLNLVCASSQFMVARASSIGLCAQADLENKNLNLNFNLNYLRKPQAQRILEEKNAGELGKGI